MGVLKLHAGGVVGLLLFGVVWGRTNLVTLRTSSTPSTSTTVTTTSTSPPFNMTPITLAPGQKINYTLELINNGPVVLDAQITFIARLRDKEGKIAQSKEFRYDWNNNADQEFMSAKGDLEYSYLRQFRSSVTKSGTWVMTVAVYTGSDYGEIINFGSMKFQLTDTLNGFMHIQQALEYQRDKNIFASDKKIELYANHTDKFAPLLRNPLYNFFWYQNNEYLQQTTTPYFNLTIPSEGNFSIQIEFFANFNEMSSRRRNASSKSHLLNSCGGGGTLQGWNSSQWKRIQRKIPEKCGVFTHRVTVKKSLKLVDIVGDRSVAIGQYIVVNVTCKGSFPTSVCWNMTALNTSEPSLNASCSPEEFQNTCSHIVRIKLTQLGWKTVWFTVYNDVSYMSSPFNVYAYDPHSVNVPALTIPIVFCTMGVLVIIIGSMYLYRLKKKPVVEVADFDFHPSVSENTPNFLSKLANKIRIAWLRNTYSNKHRTPNFHETTAKQYGSINLHESL